MLKLWLIQLANLVGPKQRFIAEIAKELTFNGQPHVMTFRHLELTPHAWQANLAYWLIGDVALSRIKWDNLPTYLTEYDPYHGRPNSPDALKFYQLREELKNDLDRTLLEPNVRRNSWCFGYQPVYYKKLSGELAKLLCFEDPRPIGMRANIYQGKMPASGGCEF